MASLPLLSMIIFVPVVGSIVLLFVPPDRKRALYTVALGVSGLTFLLSLPLFFGISGKETGFSFVEAHEWIPAYGIRYHLGVDGISMLLVLLTTFLTPITILSSWRAIGRSVRRYLCCLLLLEGGMLGVFMALDLFVFYLFWEAMLIPMYLLIGIWGGERRIYAAIKFFLYTMVGSVLMLVAILYLAIAHQAQFGAMSFGLTDLIDLSLSPAVSIWLFAAFALAFAIKVPIFPFHTWLPDAHVEAPTGGSVILAGVLLKMGVYGFLRFAYPLFPGAAEAATPVIFTLAVIGIIYGALVAMVQRDIKKLVAYSSVSHLGFCMLGLFALTVQGMKGGIL
ncbi:MAG: NADH-quinone oxidoreductase subunit M, partial [Deltaproteobacteria bacterium]